MSLEPSQVERLARLAGLRLEPGEAERRARELSAVLEEIAALRDVEPSGAGARRDDGARSDEEAEDSELVGAIGDGAEGVAPRPPEPDPLGRDLAELAPAWRDGFFVVPSPGAFGGPGEEDATDRPPPDDAGEGGGP